MGKAIFYIIILIQLFIQPGYSQVQFNKQKIIDTSLSMPQRIHIADIDGDNDKDLVVCAYVNTPKVAWYENTDGKGSFSNAKTISDMNNAASSVFTSDIDADGDLDILVAHRSGGLLWFENQDGNGTFDAGNLITNLHTTSAIAGDFDGDKNVDVFASHGVPDLRLSWYEYVPVQNSFQNKANISIDDHLINDLYLADIDGDNDNDVLVAASNNLTWLENTDGNGSFGALHVIVQSVNCACRVFALDFDNDGDLDVLSASTYNDHVFWNENLDGRGAFSPAKIISNQTFHVDAIFPVDLDMDGDIDVLSTKSSNDALVWFKTIDGPNAFSEAKIITHSINVPVDICAADIDSDGDTDVFSVSENDNKIAWYENLVNPTSVQENQSHLPNSFQLHQNYPNPFNPATTIRFTLQKSEHISLKIYNLAGQEIETLVDGVRSAGKHQVLWQAKGLPSGIYFAQLKANSEMKTMKMVLQK